MQQKLQKQHHGGSPDSSAQVTQLVEEARAGDRLALERLVGLFQDDIFRMVYHRTRSSVDAEDLTQEIFMQALKNISKLKKVDRFKSWLFSIAVNRVRDFNRKKRFQWLLGPLSDAEKETQSDFWADGNPEALDSLVKKDFWNQVALLLNKLPRMEREVFILRFMDQLSLKEVSLVMKKSESTVKTHLYRALHKFRKESSMLQFLEEDAL